MSKKKLWQDWAWNAWCIISGIGIWPRFIEPQLLEVKRINLPIHPLSDEASGLRILHFSDLHWNARFSQYLKKKLIRKINNLKPDIIVFTGDFLCKSKLEDPEGMYDLLNSLKASIGHFAVLGNHDYANYVTVNAQGDYDIEQVSETTNIAKGFKLLFQSVTLTKQTTANAKETNYHKELHELIKKTPFQLLNNTTKQFSYRGSTWNICGLEEYSLGKANPALALQNYDRRFPGIVLCHNPDALGILKDYPGDIILSGHTHGGQINLPILWKKLTKMENHVFKKGLKNISGKKIYINRGIASVMNFRWFAMPELTLLTIQRG